MPNDLQETNSSNPPVCDKTAEIASLSFIPYFTLDEKKEVWCRKFETLDEFLNNKEKKSLDSNTSIDKITLFFWKVLLKIPAMILMGVSKAIRNLCQKKVAPNQMTVDYYETEFEEWKKFTCRTKERLGERYKETKLIEFLIQHRISRESCEFDLILYLRPSTETCYIFEPDGPYPSLHKKIKPDERVLILCSPKFYHIDRKYKKSICGNEDAQPTDDQIREYLKDYNEKGKETYSQCTFHWITSPCLPIDKTIFTKAAQPLSSSSL